MSNNDEILTGEEEAEEEEEEEDDAFGEEMSNAYRLDATGEYDDNDEGTVEYLDLDLEVDSIPESTPEEYIPEAAASRTKPQAGSLAPKKSYHPEQEAKSKRSRHAGSASAPTLSIVRTKSGNRPGKRKMDGPVASVTVHAAVNAINAKLADAARPTNTGGRNVGSHDGEDSRSVFRAAFGDDSESLRSVKRDVKTEGDSLDLFFQSMAQTVLNLPSQVQAKIKMDICKVITMAEIKYCSPDTLPDANKF